MVGCPGPGQVPGPPEKGPSLTSPSFSLDLALILQKEPVTQGKESFTPQPLKDSASPAPTPLSVVGEDRCRVTSPGAIVSRGDFVRQSGICAAPARTSALVCRKKDRSPRLLSASGFRHLQVGPRPRPAPLQAEPYNCPTYTTAKKSWRAWVRGRLVVIDEGLRWDSKVRSPAYP